MHSLQDMFFGVPYDQRNFCFPDKVLQAVFLDGQGGAGTEMDDPPLEPVPHDIGQLLKAQWHLVRKRYPARFPMKNQVEHPVVFLDPGNAELVDVEFEFLPGVAGQKGEFDFADFGSQVEKGRGG